MGRRNYIDGLYFELVYSITCENKIIHVLDAINYVWEFFQLAALVFARQVPWGAQNFQTGLSYVLLSFEDRINTYVYMWLVILMDLLLIYLMVELHRKGGINSFRTLSVCRVLVGVLGTSLFFPILKESLWFISQFAFLGANSGIQLPEVIVVAVVVPELSLPDIVKTAGTVLWNILKVIISLSYFFLWPAPYSVVLFVCLTLMGLSAFVVAPYLFPLTSALWMTGQAGVVFAAALGIAVSGTSGSPDPYFYTAVFAWPIFSAIVVAYFVSRLQTLLAGFPIWRCEYHRVRLLLRRALNMPTIGMTGYREAISAASLGIPNALVIAFTLFSSGGTEMGEYIVDFLAKATKKYAGVQVVRSAYISMSACLGEETPKTRMHIQSMIRKELKSGSTMRDDFEIDSFRKNMSDMRRMKMLDVIKYHYNFTEANKHHSAALNWALRFWKAIAAERLHLESIGFMAEHVHAHQAAAFQHYHVLLQDFPSSLPGLRSYAAFVSECLNNPTLSQDVTEYADRIEEERNEAVEEVQVNTVSRTNKSSGILDDDRSEKQSSVGQSTEMFKSLDASSIFDISSFEEQRNAVAMKSVKRVSLSVVTSMFLLFVVVIAFYVVGGFLQAQELQQRNLLLNAGLLRITCAQSATLMRQLYTDLENGVATNATIASYQAQSLSLATLLVSYLDMILYQAPIFPPDVVSFWRQPQILSMVSYSPPVQALISPEDFLQTFAVNMMSISNAPKTNITVNNNDLLWNLFNGASPLFFNTIFGVVSAYQNSYFAFINSALQTGLFAFIPVFLLPGLAFCCLFLPIWLRLARELEAINRLFVQVPRKVAAVLVKEMRERVTENEEGKGLEHDEVEAAAHDAAERDDQQEVSAKKQTSLAKKLLYTYLGSLGVAFAFVILMMVAIFNPLSLYVGRASLINYSGVRITTMVRAYGDTQELLRFDTRIWASRDQIRNDIMYLANFATQAHQYVLYGNATLNIPPMLGKYPAIDNATFSKNCADLSVVCFSIDEAVNAFMLRATRLTSLSDTALLAGAGASDISDIQKLGNASAVAPLRVAVLAIRTLYGQINQTTIDIMNILSIVLVSACFPAFAVIWLYNRKTLNRVSSRIRRTRNLLYQLPQETVQSLPVIAKYLQFGTIPKLQKSTQPPGSPISARRGSMAKAQTAKGPGPNLTVVDKSAPMSANRSRQSSFSFQVSAALTKDDSNPRLVSGDDLANRSSGSPGVSPSREGRKSVTFGAKEAVQYSLGALTVDASGDIRSNPDLNDRRVTSGDGSLDSNMADSGDGNERQITNSNGEITG
ncbi:hypothetical protein RI367_001497 [Sorochytrium milnesiophthora]